jgi:hypothetical protein
MLGDALTVAIDRARASFEEKPISWALAALVVVGLYGIHTLGQERTALCDLIQQPLEWSAPALPKASDGSFDADAFIKLRGEVWRWQDSNRKQIERICAEPELTDGI